MDQELIEAAQNGDIDALYVSIERRPSILDEINGIRFMNTPLHWAVLAGHTSFVIEIANLMPSFIIKLNPQGLSPLHLASANGHLEIVKELLKIDNKSCNPKGRERSTPLHCAAIGGHINVLEELLSSCPSCITDLTLKGETALHLASKYDQIQVFKELVKWLRSHWQHDLLSCQDQEGNTVLHLAILRGHHEIVELLLHRCNFVVRNAVQVNATNKDGFTALDLLLELPRLGEQEREREIERMLRGAGARRGQDVRNGRSPRIPSMIKWVCVSVVRPVLKYFSFRVDPNTPVAARNTLLVVVALIVTATYQTGITPPGGFWQDDYQNTGGDDTEPSHFAGDSVWYTYSPYLYNLVMFLNYAGFIVSSVLVFNLTEGFSHRGPLLIALMCMAITYMLSTPVFISYPRSKNERVYNGLMTWLPFVLILIFWALTGNWIRKVYKQLLLLLSQIWMAVHLRLSQIWILFINSSPLS